MREKELKRTLSSEGPPSQRRAVFGGNHAGLTDAVCGNPDHALGHELLAYQEQREQKQLADFMGSIP